MIQAQEALTRLKAGNADFVAGSSRANEMNAKTLRTLAAGQSPYAIILGCSDSRVPAEIVFNQGLGDLFVIRVAGNIVAPSQVGSVEFAAESFGTRLVVVLGHSNCGAITATIDGLNNPGAAGSKNLQSIVDRVRPAIEELVKTDLRDQPEELVKHAVRANVRASVNHLRHGSQLLEKLIREDGLLVVGAEYDLNTGEVEFLEG